MSTNPVDLPDDLQSYVEENAKHGGFANASEYIVALVAAASEKRTEIEMALLDGLSSGPVKPWTDEEWQGMSARVASQGPNA